METIRRFHLLNALVASAALFVLACSGGSGGGNQGPTRGLESDVSGPVAGPPPVADRELGATDFVSAEADVVDAPVPSSPEVGDVLHIDVAEDAGIPAGSERTVEEGDIYRVLGNNLIANVNHYRGLQIVDFTDVDKPEIIGRLQISGTPVEMHVVDDNAFVLMNNWHGYYYGRAENGDDDGDIEQWYGGVAISVDISNPTYPRILSHARITGDIRKSRLAREGSLAALYVVTGGYDHWQEGDEWVWESRTVVKSFDVSDGVLAARSEINLGGYVTDIAATPQALLVARYDWEMSGGSRVSLIDISNPYGNMTEGAQITAAGHISSQFNMDLYSGILRIASGGGWSGTDTNHLETFDASDIHDLRPIDHETFGAGEDLYATLFLGEKAFFVTYLRVDPFHAFHIDANGSATEMSQFVVSGWNDFFKPTMDNTRLVGVGIDDEDGWSMAVSLYDITDLTNPNPLIARKDVAAGYSWSEARWDHRAFSVLDGVVEATGPNGEIETGLVLLPFSGWSDDHGTYTAGVQVYTFSADSLTQRDVMIHGTPVRRSFPASDELIANLSEAELSLFDCSNPAECAELGRVELAPNFTDYLIFGEYGVRVKSSRDYYYYWWGDGSDLPPATVEVVPLQQHPDLAEPVVSFTINANARIYQTGDLLVCVTTVRTEGSDYPYEYESTVEVYDLSDPASPSLAAGFTTDKIRPSYGGYLYLDDCWDCVGEYLPYFGREAVVEPIPNGLVFPTRRDQRELLGVEHVCRTYAAEEGSCWGGWNDSCTYYTGSIVCRRLNDEPETCSGEILRCTYFENGDRDCQAVDPGAISTEEHCYDYDRYRYWQSFSLEALNLTDPLAPTFTSVVLPDEEAGVAILARGSDVWVSYNLPEDVPHDGRQYVRYHVKRVNFGDIAIPEIGPGINVPGELIDVQDRIIFTRDVTWGGEMMETSIARLELLGDLAHLRAIRTFTDQWVESVVIDGAEHILVSHRNGWHIDTDDRRQYLSILDANSHDLAILSKHAIADWAQLRDAKSGRALFQVSGGLLVYNYDEVTEPYPQAYYALRGWPNKILIAGADIIVPAGRFGIYRFDFDAENLLEID